MSSKTEGKKRPTTAKIEPMNAKPAQEKGEHACNDLALHLF